MQWTILLLLIPMVLVPIVLLWGFAGCAAFGTDNLPTPFKKPSGLSSESVSSSEVKLTWNPTPGEVTLFRVRRTEENSLEGPIEISKGKEPRVGSFDDNGQPPSSPLKPGTTYIYTVTATAMAGTPTLNTPDSDPSDSSSVTTFPAPSVVSGTALASNDGVSLGWTKSDKAARYRLNFRSPPGNGTFTMIYEGPDLSFSHTGLPPGKYEYQVFAILEHGHQKGENDKEILSDPSPSITVELAGADPGFHPVFVGLPSLRQDNVTGYCIVQKIDAGSLLGTGTKVRITLQPPPAGFSLTLDRVYISWVAGGTADPYDSLLGDPSQGGLTKVWDKDLDGGPKVLAGGSEPLVLGPVDFKLEGMAVLVAFDTSGTAGQGTLMRNPSSPGATSYALAAKAEAAKADRSAGYVAAPGNLYLIKQIDAHS